MLLVPPLIDPERLQAISDALGNWAYSGFIDLALTETALAYLVEQLEITTPKALGRLMFEYVHSGGTIDEVPETRANWIGKWACHYDFRLLINQRPVYVETRLRFNPPFCPDEPSILVVNIHDV